MSVLDQVYCILELAAQWLVENLTQHYNWKNTVFYFSREL
jgi:hypothetical protein